MTDVDTVAEELKTFMATQIKANNGEPRKAALWRDLSDRLALDIAEWQDWRETVPLCRGGEPL